MAESLAPHHDFTPPTKGSITCQDCGRTHDLDGCWRFLIEPCGDTPGLDITPEEARARVERALLEIMYGQDVAHG